MKARKILPIGMAAAILSGASLSGIVPTRMSGIGEPEELQGALYGSETFDSASGFVESSPFDPGSGFAEDPEALAYGEEDRPESIWYERDTGIEMSPADLAQAPYDAGYAINSDEFAYEPEPLPAPQPHDFAPYAGAAHLESSRLVAAPTTQRHSPADAQPPARRERTLDPIY